MSNQNTSVLRSLVVLKKGDRTYFSVGRAIRNVAAYKRAMTSSESQDSMGRHMGAAYGFDVCAVILDAADEATLQAGIARLREDGIASEEEAREERSRTERYRALVSTLRTSGLKVTIRNGDQDGETRRLTISGSQDARDAFMRRCSLDQAAWVKATFAPVEGRPDLRSGVVSLAD